MCQHIALIVYIPHAVFQKNNFLNKNKNKNFFWENFLQIPQIHNIDFQRIKNIFGKLYVKNPTNGFFVW